MPGLHRRHRQVRRFYCGHKMAQCVYLVCSESFSLDRDTGIISVFKLLERVAIVTRHEGMREYPLKLCAIAAWSSEPEDQSERFEAALRIVNPNGEEKVLPVSAPFSFEKELHRIIVNLTIGLDARTTISDGLLQLQSRIRKVGESDWIESMVYPVRIDVRTGKSTEGE